jgi:hypothetical protein
MVDEAHAVAISTVAATTSATPVIDRRDRLVSCFGARSMTHLRTRTASLDAHHVYY